jgi:RNA polymerase sigma-70 factor (ECF subfamily)
VPDVASGDRSSVAIRAEEIDLTRDRDLVVAWQAGDERAFDELYRMHFDRLRAFCQRRVGDRSVAEEIAQESFVRALQALPRFQGERKFYPWMTVIAGRLCIDHHRRNGRVQPTDDVDTGHVEDGHDERIALQVDLEHLDRAFSRLGPRHAEVLELRERRGLSYHDIAAELEVPHSTVEALLFRARKALRREFQLVSAERLAAIPGVGWVLTKSLRLRDRLAHVGNDLGNLAAPLAAGAVTAVLVALPASPAPVPETVVSGSRPAPATAPPAAELPGPDLPEPAAPSFGTGGSPDAPPAAPVPAPRVDVVTDEDAKQRASNMPLKIDLPEAGAGLDPAAALARIPSLLRSNP